MQWNVNLRTNRCSPQATILYLTMHPARSAAAISQHGTGIAHALRAIGPPAPANTYIYMQGFSWAMAQNHLGILRRLSAQGFFEIPSLNCRAFLLTAAERGNFEALAVVVKAMTTRLSDACIDGILTVTTDCLSTPPGDSADAPGEPIEWRVIRAMFLVLQKIVNRVHIAVGDMQEIPDNTDAMDGLLLTAAALCPPNYNAVWPLLQRTGHSSDALGEAIALLQGPGTLTLSAHARMHDVHDALRLLVLRLRSNA
jgi:hypothetical protein